MPVSDWIPCTILTVEAFRLGSVIVTVVHLLALAINHYIGIVRPLHYAAIMTKRTVTICIIAMWILPNVAILTSFSTVENQGFQVRRTDGRVKRAATLADHLFGAAELFDTFLSFYGEFILFALCHFIWPDRVGFHHVCDNLRSMFVCTEPQLYVGFHPEYPFPRPVLELLLRPSAGHDLYLRSHLRYHPAAPGFQTGSDSTQHHQQHARRHQNQPKRSHHREPLQPALLGELSPSATQRTPLV